VLLRVLFDGGGQMNQLWLSVAEAARILNVSEPTVRRRAHQGKLRSRQGKSGKLEVQVKTKVADKSKCPTASDNTDTHKPASNKQQQQNPWLQKYAPLPNTQVGTPIDPDEKPTGLPLARKNVAGKAHPSATTHDKNQPIPLKPLGLSMMNRAQGDDDDLTRFQRMAGASLMLAQNQVNEANEKLAIVRHELHRSRKVTRWAVAAATLAMAICLFTLAGRGGNALNVQAQTSEAVTQAIHQQARQWQDELIVTRQELTAYQDQSRALEKQLASAEQEAQKLNQRLSQLESRATQPPRTENN